MKITSFLLAAAVLGLRIEVSAYLVDPPTFAADGTVSDCSGWHVAAAGDACPAIASDWGISVSDFSTVYNPSIGTACRLNSGQSYCVERNWGIPPETPTTSSTTSTTPTPTGGNGVTTPLPTQSGMASNCNKFVLVTGGGCWDVANAAGISLQDFYAWNKGVGANCETLWAETYYCIGIIGGTTASPTITTSTTRSTTSTRSTTTGNGVTTPLPTQSGMVTNCNKFYKTQPGQSCADVINANSITLANFYAWNTGIGQTCNNMWADTWYCVGLIGQTTTTTRSTSTTRTTTTSTRTSTTTSRGNGVATPTPTQPGMISNCDRFYFVTNGELCSTVLSKNGLTMAQFFALNPGVQSDCRGLWAGVYVCTRALR
ncbi:hypothetical protein QBC34DRAFT_314201 [Podospora aff. communis PSN243]|uniref:LysM domain-containing protein n=1 Tax=Podospora aff. communis PSN243 TaxID=3040156 RepID=A0AAV9FZ44_9PEZI|nr:hypothetical protein QBC34DRAFT_314201 [Podospora aff. communis PSN243]